jgi:hypothetical protein
VEQVRNSVYVAINCAAHSITEENMQGYHRSWAAAQLVSLNRTAARSSRHANGYGGGRPAPPRTAAARRWGRGGAGAGARGRQPLFKTALLPAAIAWSSPQPAPRPEAKLLIREARARNPNRFFFFLTLRAPD